MSSQHMNHIDWNQISNQLASNPLEELRDEETVNISNLSIASQPLISPALLSTFSYSADSIMSLVSNFVNTRNDNHGLRPGTCNTLSSGHRPSNSNCSAEQGRNRVATQLREHLAYQQQLQQQFENRMPPNHPQRQLRQNQQPSSGYRQQQEAIRFNIDNVTCIKRYQMAREVVKKILDEAVMLSFKCDSDDSLDNSVDILEMAVCYDWVPHHPKVYLFDIKDTPGLMDLMRPVFASPRIVKIGFNVRQDLRILRRKYNIDCMVALFDVSLAYRFLYSKLTGIPIERLKPEKLMYVSFQCKGPLVNFEKYLIAQAFYKQGFSYWSVRPMNVGQIHNASFDVFVLVPQLTINLMYVMEHVLAIPDKKEFLDLSNKLIDENLVVRSFPKFARSKNSYLQEAVKTMQMLKSSAAMEMMDREAELQREKKRSFVNAMYLAQQREAAAVDDSTSAKSGTSDFGQIGQARDENLFPITSSARPPLADENIMAKKIRGDHMVANERCMNLLVDQMIDLLELKEDLASFD